MIREVTEGIYQIRYEDKNINYFEALWEIPEGISYNSYFLKTDFGNFLVDTWKVGLEDKFLSELESLTDKIDYLIVQHMEQDHSGCISAVLEKFSPKIIGHPMVKRMLENFYGISPEFIPVKDGEEKFGFRFFYAPWLHWPENILTYYPKEKILFSNDIFGSYGLRGFEEELFEKYFANVIGKYWKKIGRLLEKLGNIEVKKILPAHGEIINKKAIQIYKEIFEGRRLKDDVVFVYDSIYGNLHSLFSEVIGRLRDKRISFFAFLDNGRPNLSDAIHRAFFSKKLVFGASMYENRPFPIMRMVLDLIHEKIPKKSALFVVWGGWAPIEKEIEEIFEDWEREIIKIKSVRDKEEVVERILEWVEK